MSQKLLSKISRKLIFGFALSSFMYFCPAEMTSSKVLAEAELYSEMDTQIEQKNLENSQVLAEAELYSEMDTQIEQEDLTSSEILEEAEFYSAEDDQSEIEHISEEDVVENDVCKGLGADECFKLAAEEERKRDARSFYKAMLLYNAAAKKGHPEAAYIMAFILVSGGTIVPDYEQAVYYLESAVQKNHQESLFLLAMMTYHGLGTKKDIQKSVSLIEKAAKGNSGEAYYILGNMRSVGIEGILEKDIKQAKKHYEKAEELNVADAKYKLAALYYEGSEEIPQDYDKAFKLYKEAYDKGSNYHVEILRMLSSMYFRGVGTPKNKKMALQNWAEYERLSNLKALSEEYDFR